MATKRKTYKHRQFAQQTQAGRQTNWLVLGGVVLGGLLIVAGLLWLAWKPQPATARTLSAYCAQNEGSCVSLGSESAPVTVVEVSDYGCGHCRDFNLTTAPLLEEAYVASNQVRWVVVPFALRPQTVPAAAAAMCAAEQDAFLAYHRTLFQGTPQGLTRAGFIEAAGQVAGQTELDVGQFSACIDANRYNATVQTNSQAASNMGVSGTPTFFINDGKLEGNWPLEAFQSRINELLN